MLTKGGVYTCLRQHSIDPEAAHWCWEVIFSARQGLFASWAASSDLVVLTCRSVYSPLLSLHTFHFPAEQSEYIVKLGVANVDALWPKREPHTNQAGPSWKTGEVPFERGWWTLSPCQIWACRKVNSVLPKIAIFFQDEEEIGIFRLKLLFKMLTVNSLCGFFFFLSLQGK